jgi:hypothetical protein
MINVNIQKPYNNYDSLFIKIIKIYKLLVYNFSKCRKCKRPSYTHDYLFIEYCNKGSYLCGKLNLTCKRCLK